jgi:putative ABC transport system ATP-binding protein
MIKLINVTKKYNENKHNECVAVNSISLEIPLNSVTVFCGPSGSGKTTLLSLIGAMIKPTHGRIFFLDKEITSISERFLSKFRREQIGFIFQKFNLIKNLTILQNLIIPLVPLGLSSKEAKKKAMILLDKFDMKSLANTKVEYLSGGEAQRVAIARALINNPNVVVADEPSANLDSENTQNILEIFKNLLLEKKTIIIASHDPLIYNSEIVNLKVQMRDGRIIDV